MQHHILVKWSSAVPDKTALLAPIEALFRQTLALPGVHAVSLHPNVIDRPNRYDLLIRITMDENALPTYDSCEAHHQWKEQYGPLIDKKAIFDCD